ncbi:virulence factor Mce family protein [Mycobacterium sp. CBMA293]|uniref:virulence factor Mce family protein n=1 Tax=unclassified Mycolicibacterium TaxID=2636767 RepID=UPI0012DCADD9|nr:MULTISPECIES: virulence factor Mce family protein [unclassified Mycolicibacterium]MUL46316.1 virulence factor Mce family protein [Mycolicibacterium sp. CBMA 360]MUL57172.1 virulence factor Mce family protein [Mycolicibacterium sp. CBMA 335]MUL70212.1 virulence factor Mce family protein [Mycolicibacterium sp. CBMA 311]MUL92260.1 virulence factor Mce family protein [Mycolicibacterium sp. CBMA 230]MUM04808.1 mammalian cell entry protein [Mycolicibacterium sp. CBMA 213]
MNTRWSRYLVGVGLVATLVSTSGCSSWRGLNSLPMPGTQGHEAGSFQIQVQMPDVTNLQPNSRVRVSDVSVGTVTKIERQDWHALLTISLNGDVDLPSNATVKLGQTSLLGSLHLELAPPANQPSEGRLRQGSLIPLSHSGSYPTTEETLAAVSTVLNGGGLGQLQDITEAFSTAFKGREKDLRSLVGQLDSFTANLNDDTPDIIAATDSLNQLAGKLAAKQPVLDKALQAIPDALAELNKQKNNLIDAADQLGKFSALTVDTVNQTKENLIKELQQVGPVLESLANAGPSLTRSLSYIPTFPFPNETIDKWQRGDYANLTAIVDLTLSRLDAGLFTGTRWEGNLTQLEMQWGRTIGQFPSPYTKDNPLVAPYRWDQGP